MMAMGLLAKTVEFGKSPQRVFVPWLLSGSEDFAGLNSHLLTVIRTKGHLMHQLCSDWRW
jgi:hypothetical protein